MANEWEAGWRTNGRRDGERMGGGMANEWEAGWRTVIGRGLFKVPVVTSGNGCEREVVQRMNEYKEENPKCVEKQWIWSKCEDVKSPSAYVSNIIIIIGIL